MRVSTMLWANVISAWLHLNLSLALQSPAASAIKSPVTRTETTKYYSIVNVNCRAYRSKLTFRYP